MAREIGRLRALASRGARPDAPAWRDTVQASSAVLARGVAELLDSLKVPAMPVAAERDTTPETHLRAQRFATVRVAEIQLYQAAQVKAGRAAADLYGTLKSVLDAARFAYAEQFLTPVNGVPDYLHREIVKVLANNDVKLLGAQYPGPLV